MEAAHGQAMERGEPRTWAELASSVLGRNVKGQPLEPCPDVPFELLHVEAAHGRFATDGNGRALGAEFDRWFRDNGVRDPGMREAYEHLWRGMEAETARVRAEEIERLQRDRER